MRKSSAKDSHVRKVLVRNAILPEHSRKRVDKKQKQVTFVEHQEETSSKVEKDYSSPELYSILKLADEIKEVKLKNAVGKKTERNINKKPCNLNFQPNEKLYKDLVSLDVPNHSCRTKVKPSCPPRNLLKKDPEPNFKEFFKYSLQPGYVFTKLAVPEVKKPTPQYDGRSIYRKTKKWES